MLSGIEGLNLKGKRVLLRVDINSPMKDGQIINDGRIRNHISTIKNLSEQGARVILLAHQGRPGSSDFSHLHEHSNMISKYCDNVEFVEDIIGPTARGKIGSMDDNQVLLLDNVRILSEEMLKASPEEHSKSLFVQTLSKHTDFFVNDAFSVSHRNQASIVGFPVIMKSYAGESMKTEIEGLERIKDAQNLCLVLGGSKPDDVIDFLRHLAPRAQKILVGGMIGELFCHANGVDMGDKKSHYQDHSESLHEMRQIYNDHKEKFVLPVDFAIDDFGERREVDINDITGLPMDIGSKTADVFGEAISDSDHILMKGPMGAYENSLFFDGSRGVMRHLEDATNNGSFTVVCGGHTHSIAENLQFKPSHSSLSGGAFIKYLTGQSLPGIEILKN